MNFKPHNEAILAFKIAALNQMDHVFAASRGQQDAMTRIGVEAPISVLRNCRMSRANERSSQIRDDCGIGEATTLVLCINTDSFGGGLHETLEAVKVLGDRYHLAFLGSNRLGDADDPERLAKALGIPGRCSVLPLVPPSTYTNYISGADVIAVPAAPILPDFETCLPNQLFEAVSARVPLVGPEHTAIGEFIQRHNVGTIYESTGAIEIAAAIKMSSSTASLQESLDSAAQELTWEKEQALVEAQFPTKRTLAFVFANKPLDRNNRIHRIAKTLSAGFDEVHVFGQSLPMDDLLVGEVTYHAISVV